MVLGRVVAMKHAVDNVAGNALWNRELGRIRMYSQGKARSTSACDSAPADALQSAPDDEHSGRATTTRNNWDARIDGSEE